MKPWRVAALALLTLGALPALAAGPPRDAPAASLYQLDASLTAQDGRAIGLGVYRGQPVLVTMFFAGCQATCPVIIDTLRAVERKLDGAQRKNVRVLLISIDPEHDTVEALATLARERRIDTSRWTLARTDAKTVRQVAAALGVQYRRLPDGQFSHATQISALDSTGSIVAQSATLGHADDKLVAALSRPDATSP
jgi:protein SCO1/2